MLTCMRELAFGRLIELHVVLRAISRGSHSTLEILLLHVAIERWQATLLFLVAALVRVLISQWHDLETLRP
jgi:hypothetical protein